MLYRLFALWNHCVQQTIPEKLASSSVAAVRQVTL